MLDISSLIELSDISNLLGSALKVVWRCPSTRPINGRGSKNKFKFNILEKKMFYVIIYYVSLLPLLLVWVVSFQLLISMTQPRISIFKHQFINNSKLNLHQHIKQPPPFSRFCGNRNIISMIKSMDERNRTKKKKNSDTIDTPILDIIQSILIRFLQSLKPMLELNPRFRTKSSFCICNHLRLMTMVARCDSRRRDNNHSNSSISIIGLWYGRGRSLKKGKKKRTKIILSQKNIY